MKNIKWGYKNKFGFQNSSEARKYWNEVKTASNDISRNFLACKFKKTILFFSHLPKKFCESRSNNSKYRIEYLPIEEIWNNNKI